LCQARCRRAAVGGALGMIEGQPSFFGEDLAGRRQFHSTPFSNK
jgi:hypothetical protein